MVETIHIETVTDLEAEARKLAQKHLDSLNTPSANFIWVKRAVRERSVDYPDLLEEFAPELARKNATKPAAAKPPTEERPLQAAGRIGA
jgi:hypothetical protein